MESIPHELLQLIASWLLPRYQCRLALASRYQYRYLYSDLLRWHARKSTISVPKCKYIDDIVIRSLPNRLYYMVPSLSGGLYILDMTRPHARFISPSGRLGCRTNSSRIYDDIMKHGIEMFDGFYKNMDRGMFILCASMRISSLLSLPHYILENIFSILPREDCVVFLELHEYLLFNDRLSRLYG